MIWLIRVLAAGTSLWFDDVWVADSTPVECGRSRESVRRSDLAGSAEYGYCASHSRCFWGLRLHLLCTLHGLPASFAITGAKADERQLLLGILDDPQLMAGRTRQVIIADKNYYGHDLETTLASGQICLLRPPRAGEPGRPGNQFFKPLRQIIESVNDPLKGQLDLERHGGHAPVGVIARILALTAAIWHNDHADRPVMRSLIAYDHRPLGIDRLAGVLGGRGGVGAAGRGVPDEHARFGLFRRPALRLIAAVVMSA